MSVLAVAAIAVTMSLVGLVAMRRWRRAGQNQRVTLALGLLLIGLSLLAGVWLLPVHRPPAEETRGVGVVPPARASPGRGFVVSAGVTVRDCGKPVEVALVTGGSAEYWRDHSEMRGGPRELIVALPWTGVDDLRVGVTSRETDIQLPGRAQPTSAPYFRAETRERSGHTIVSASVSDWSERLSSVVVRFEADLLVRRGLGSCFLRLPKLTGSASVLAAQLARGDAVETGPEPADPGELVVRSKDGDLSAPYDPSLETTLGSATVVVEDGSVLADASLPGPDQIVEGHPAWVCRTSPIRTGVLSKRGPRRDADIITGRIGGGAYSTRYLQRSLIGDCSSTVAISERSAGISRDLVLLLIGALFGLGTGMVVEVFTSWLKRPPGNAAPPRRWRVRRRPRRAGDA